jgi:hypothetical protein
MRIGPNRPYKMKVWKLIRGERMFCENVWAMRGATWMSQQEAGYTYVHTWEVLNWSSCFWRYFYFYGVMSGGESKSKSPIFSHHHQDPPYGPPVTVKFYPEAHPEVWAVDGQIGRTLANSTWTSLHDSAGTEVNDSGGAMIILITSHANPSRWTQIYRCIIVFDTRSIPLGSAIDSAKVSLRKSGGASTAGWPCKYAIFQSWPVNNNALALADYQNTGIPLFSNEVAYADWPSATRKEFNLNYLGLPWVIPGAVTKLAVRESHYDAKDTAPPWVASKSTYININTRDGGLLISPWLEVTYRPPL